jgi:hypothetical protein
MGNYSNELGLLHFTLSTANETTTREGLLYMFDADMDFTQNEEYYRKNTLKLGYINEAHRVVAEFMEDKTIETLTDVISAITYLSAKVFGNQTYFRQYEISVNEFDTKTYSVAISYIS